MTISCEIIKDLLPLYHDCVCSNESKAAIDEHFAACEKCKEELAAMQSSLCIGGVRENIKEAEAVKALSIRWKKGMVKSLVKGALITLAVIAVIALIVFIFADVRIFYA